MGTIDWSEQAASHVPIANSIAVSQVVSAENRSVGVLGMLGRRFDGPRDKFCILWTLGANGSLIKRFLGWLTMAQDPVARTLPTPSMTILEFVSSHATYHTISLPNPSLE